MGWHTYFCDLEAGTTKAVDNAPGGISALSGTTTIPQLTTDGRFVIFESPDSSLVSNDGNGCVDVFVRDLLTETTELISGGHVTLPSHSPRAISRISSQPVSDDGRIVVFSSAASDLLPGATNSPGDVFARDRLFETNLPVNVSSSADPGNGPAFDPALSGNGRFVAFTSWANNLSSQAESNHTSDVYVRDLQAGTTALISIETSGLTSGNAASHSPAISADGRFVLFRSLAANLAVGSYTGENLFLRDRKTETTYALTSSGLQCHAMTPDGRYVVFSTSRILLWDSLEARVVWTNLTSTTRISLSPDGNKIAFYSYPGNITIADRAASSSWTVPSAQNFHPGLRFSTNGNWLVYVAVSNGFNQVFLHHVQFRTNELITRAFGAGLPASGHSDSPDISPDGRFIAYRSAAPDLVPGDHNVVPDVFLHDRLSHTTVLLSANLFGSAPAANRSATPVFSGDGQTIVFQSWALDMVQLDFNDMNDLFAWTIYASGELPLFSARISKDTGGAWLAWPVVPGKTYRVQYKSDPADPTWTDLDTGIAVLGNQGCLRDMTVGPGRRFYRVAAY